MRRHRLFAIIDSGVLKARPSLPNNLTAYVTHHKQHMELTALPHVVPGGERSKNDPRLPATLQKRLYQVNIDRQSIVLIVGGGAVLDMGGYAAATTHRGIRVIRLPTTVLSQGDGGLGVKNGVNAFGVKNFLGTFAVPFAVVNDAQFINTLPARHRISGMAEAVKVALVRDAGFFDWLEANSSALSNFEPSALIQLIHHSAEIHLTHIAASGDPFESGSARPLDFGHWAAHKLESLSGYRLHHGEAVAIGIAIDSRYSTEIGLLSEEACTRVLSLLDRLKLPSWHNTLGLREPNGRLKIIEGLDEFKEHIGGELTITLLKQIGQGTEVGQIDQTVVDRAVSWLRNRHASRCVSR
jgi:3-dehydroquinate synthase